MTVTLTKRNDVICQALVDFLTADTTLGAKEVYYGDQQKIPVTPCITVDPGPKENNLAGTGLYVQVILNQAIMIYYARIGSESNLKKESDDFVERVEDTINSEPMNTLGGLIIHGHIRRIEPGVAVRGGQRYRASLLNWRGESRTYLEGG
jgi:hypothetical protein